MKKCEYINKLQILIDFIKFLNENLPSDNKKIDFQFLCTLWEEILDDAATDEEKDILFKWLKDFSDCKVA